MKVVLKQGETFQVQFEDSDGEITVKFGKNKLTVHSDLPDTLGREGVIYEEKYGKYITEKSLWLRKFGVEV